MTRKISEMLTVKIGAVGVEGEGLGIASVTLDLDAMDDQAVGLAMAKAYRAAHMDAVREFGPKLSAVWSAQPDRIRNGDQIEDPEA